MDKVKVLLEQANVVQHLDKFEKAGYDSLAQILSMDEAELTELGQHTAMPPGHLARLRKTIHVIKNSVPTPKPVAVEPSGETTVDLKTRYLTRQELRLASLRHSTKQGCKTMVDTDKSGGRHVIYKCSSVLSKKRKADEDYDDPRPACQYRLYWAKNKKSGYWELKTKKSHLKHQPFCPSVQRVTKMELVNDPVFVKHCKIAKNVTGPKGAKEALGGSSKRRVDNRKIFLSHLISKLSTTDHS